MKWTGIVLAGVWLVGSIAATHAQLLRRPKSEDTFETPRDVLGRKLGRSLSEDDFYAYMYDFSRRTMPSEIALKKNIEQSETGPFRSRRSVWADATIVPRMREFGAGPLAAEAIERPTLADRNAASANPRPDYPGRLDEEAIMAGVYRHFFDYRNQGFAKDADVYFLGAGPHVIDVSPGLLAALQSDPRLKSAGIRLQPMHQVLEVTNEALRDRETGGTGPAFRVDEIGLVQDGDVRVVATFGEREGFWFTREMTLRRDRNGGWTVAEDRDLPTR